MEIRTTQGAAHSKVIGAMPWTSKSLLVRRGFHDGNSSNSCTNLANALYNRRNGTGRDRLALREKRPGWISFAFARKHPDR